MAGTGRPAKVPLPAALPPELGACGEDTVGMASLWTRRLAETGLEYAAGGLRFLAGTGRSPRRVGDCGALPWPAGADGFTAEHAPQAYWLGLGGRAADTGAAGRGAFRLQSLVSLQCRVIGEPYSDQRRAPQATTACQDRVSGQSVQAAAGRRTYARSGGIFRSSCMPGAAGRAVGSHGSRAAGQHRNISPSVASPECE